MKNIQFHNGRRKALREIQKKIARELGKFANIDDGNGIDDEDDEELENGPVGDVIQTAAEISSHWSNSKRSPASRLGFGTGKKHTSDVATQKILNSGEAHAVALAAAKHFKQKDLVYSFDVMDRAFKDQEARRRSKATTRILRHNKAVNLARLGFPVE